jgi:hypothetical protein
MARGISDLPSTILVHHHVPRFVQRFLADRNAPENKEAAPILCFALLKLTRGASPVRFAMEPERGRTD